MTNNARKDRKRLEKRNQKIQKYYEKGATYRAIAGRFHISHTAVANVLHKNAVKARQSAQNQ